MKQKNKIVGFLPMFLGVLAASMLGRALTGRGVIRAAKNS